MCIILQPLNGDLELVVRGDAVAVGAVKPRRLRAERTGKSDVLTELLELRCDVAQPLRVGKPADQLQRLRDGDLWVELATRAEWQRPVGRLERDCYVVQVQDGTVSAVLTAAEKSEIREDFGVDILAGCTFNELGHLRRSSPVCAT